MNDAWAETLLDQDLASGRDENRVHVGRSIEAGRLAWIAASIFWLELAAGDPWKAVFTLSSFAWMPWSLVSTRLCLGPNVRKVT